MTKRHEKFNNCINKQKKQKCSYNCVGKCEKLRSKTFDICIDRNEFILGNLMC